MYLRSKKHVPPKLIVYAQVQHASTHFQSTYKAFPLKFIPSLIIVNANLMIQP